MKKIILIIAGTTLILFGCSTQKSASTTSYDDVYYAKPKHTASVETVSPSQDLSAPKNLSAPDSSTSVKHKSSNLYDDYDYSYAARLKKFSNQDTTKSYNDPSFGGQDNGNNSDSPDVNIYMGNGFGYSHTSVMDLGGVILIPAGVTPIMDTPAMNTPIAGMDHGDGMIHIIAGTRVDIGAAIGTVTGTAIGMVTMVILTIMDIPIMENAI